MQEINGDPQFTTQGVYQQADDISPGPQEGQRGVPVPKLPPKKRQRGRKSVAERPEFTRDPALAGFIKSFPFSIVSPYLAHAGWGGKLDSEGVPLFQQAMVGKLSGREFLDKFADVLTKNMG